uniref:Ribosomal subunit interface protein n=2 Tax=Ectopseudomonas TaxID=3236654 RepID=A4XWR8_ECTM1
MGDRQGHTESRTLSAALTPRSPWQQKESLMQVMVNSDNHIHGSAALEDRVRGRVTDKLKRFEDHLTRIEVHFNDENSHKSGGQDKRCQLEARLKGRDPVSVSHNADQLEQALEGAIDKLGTVLERNIGKQRPS